MKIRMNDIQKKRFERWVAAAKRQGIKVTVSGNIVRCESEDRKYFGEYQLDALLKSFDNN